MSGADGQGRGRRALRPGDRLGPYLVDERLGQGGMGTVFRATHERLGKAVALKVLSPEVAARPDVVARFEREARIQASLDHPGIVQVHDFISEGGLHAIVMELVEGVSLEDVIVVRGERYGAARCVEVLLPALDALGFAHERGVVHRDVKPSNVMLASSGGREVVKVLDFGLARALDSARLTEPDAGLGTDAYMAPEQARSAATVDLRADLYSIGVTLYELASGALPFAEEPAVGGGTRRRRAAAPLGQLVPELPEAFAAVVERAMAGDPAARYGTAAELARALEESLSPAAATGAASPARGGGGARAPARRRLEDLLRVSCDEGELPALPAAGAELLRLVHLPSDELELGDLAAVVERDPGLSGSLLRLANSPYFGLAGRVTAVRHALSIVGLVEATEALRYHLVRRAAPTPRVEGLPVDAFWAHAWATAVAARSLGRPDLLVSSLPGTLYSAALLHDVGKLVLAARLPAEYGRCLASAEEDGVDLWLVEAARLGTDHAEVGRLLLESWELPRAIVDAVAFHHAPDRAPEEARESAGLVQLGDRLAHVAASAPSGNPAPGEPGEAWLVREGGTALSSPSTLDAVTAEVARQLEDHAAILLGTEPAGPRTKGAGPGGRRPEPRTAASPPRRPAGLLDRFVAALRRLTGGDDGR